MNYGSAGKFVTGMRKPALALLAAVTCACSVNPVTGDREVVLVSEAQELQMGAQAYLPSQQSQGGAYDVDPALTRYVQEVGQRLAAQSDRQLPYEFVVLNNSVPNAWALPGGKIAINRGLLTELDSEAELAAVLGHEIVHAAARHSAQQATRGMLSQVLVLATAIVASDEDYGALAVGGANLGAQLVNLRYSRDAEREADRYGMEYMARAGYDPSGAVDLQETFVRLSESENPDWLSGLFASHPPSQERLDANRAMAESLPAGGEDGADRYKQQLAKMREVEPAYDAYEKGRKALADDDRAAALRHANEALELFPAEAHFHALRGDLRFLDKNYSDAITNYTRALERREEFFYYHLQRGLAKKAAGDARSAVPDLERSRELMPTAPAELALGDIAESRGNIDKAIAHYRAVAGAGGPYGDAANAALARLELPRNPAAYFRTGCGADRERNLIVAVRNESSVSAYGIVVAVDVVDSAGRARRLTRNINGVLAPGQVAQVNMGIGPYTGGECPGQVIAAQIAR